MPLDGIVRVNVRGYSPVGAGTSRIGPNSVVERDDDGNTGIMVGVVVRDDATRRLLWNIAQVGLMDRDDGMIWDDADDTIGLYRNTQRSCWEVLLAGILNLMRCDWLYTRA